MSHICYAPNAIPLPEYGPCNNAEDVSLCCRPGQICLTNGLCANGQGEYYSGGCTDKTYKASICPSFCTGSDKFVVECQDQTIPDGGFCCSPDGATSCCDSLNNNLNLKPSESSAAVASTISPTHASITPTSGRVSSSPGLNSLERSLTSTAVLETTLESIDSTSTRSVVRTVTATVVTVPSPSPSKKQPATQSKSSHGQTIGLSVGISLGLLFSGLIFVVAYKIWKRKYDAKQRRPKSGIVDTSDPHSSKSDPQIHELHNLSAPLPELEPTNDFQERDEAPSHAKKYGMTAEPVQELDASNPLRLSDATTAVAEAPNPAYVRQNNQLYGHDSRPGTPVLRSNNDLGPLAMPATPPPPIPRRNPSRVSRHDRSSSPAPLSAATPPVPRFNSSYVPQIDGASTPPPPPSSAPTLDRNWLQFPQVEGTSVPPPLPASVSGHNTPYVLQNDGASTPPPSPPLPTLDRNWPYFPWIGGLSCPPPRSASSSSSPDRRLLSDMKAERAPVSPGGPPSTPASNAPAPEYNLLTEAESPPTRRGPPPSTPAPDRSPPQVPQADGASDEFLLQQSPLRAPDRSPPPIPQTDGGVTPPSPPSVLAPSESSVSERSSVGSILMKLSGERSIKSPSARSLIEGEDFEQEDCPEPLDLGDKEVEGQSHSRHYSRSMES